MTRHKELPRNIIIVGVIILGGDGALEMCLKTKKSQELVKKSCYELCVQRLQINYASKRD